jgi:hypothetical protein
MNSNHSLWLSRVLALLALAAVATPVSAAEWGTIKGRFLYQGKPKVEPIVPNKDIEYCSKHELTTETVKVSDKGELQNVFVYLYTARGAKVAIHPSYDATAAAKEQKVLDNKGCRFEPHAMTLWTAQPLAIHNSDPGLGHNTNALKLVANPSFNQAIPNDQPLVKTFTKSEPIPTQVSCSIHPWMNAVMLIRDNPYMAVSGEDGSFEIKNVPAGKQPFVFWHEAKGNLRDLKVGKGKADRKGQVALDIAAGKTLDLGDITVTPAVLGK